MMPPNEAHYVLPLSIPTVVVYLMALAAVGAWVASHRLVRPAGSLVKQALGLLLRGAVGFVAMLAAAQALQRGLVLATNWPIWPIALLGAAAVEIVLGLYTLERRTISRRAGRALAVLRVGLVALVIIMLSQPVRPWELDKTIQRYVAVLLDNSASMYVPDTQLAPWERLRLAEKFAADGVRRPYAIEKAVDELDRVRGDLTAQGEWLASLGTADAAARRSQLDSRRDSLAKAFATADKTVTEQTAALAKPLDSTLKLDAKVRDAIDDLRKKLTTQVRDRLAEAMTLTNKENAGTLEREQPRLLDTVRKTTADLADLVSKAAAVGQMVDEAAYAALPEAQRSQVDSIAARKRVALARDVLLSRPAPEAGKTEKEPSLLERLQKPYAVQMYTFASKIAELNAKEWAAAYKGPENPVADAASLPPEQQQTDLGGAIEKVMSDMGDRQLSGILLVTDGRSNAAKSVEPLVQRLAMQRVPVSSIVIGGTKPPIDAGIISVEAPEAIATRDKMLVIAEVKLDGLAGQEVKVTLMEGEKAVATQTVRVPGDTFRTRVKLSDEPATTGLHHYRVEVQKFEGEVLAANNQYPLTVSVTDERTKLLMIEERPRWEFRYIKNLFTSRDRTVRLQHVLFQPDRIEGVPQPPRVEASVARPIEEVEANALPKDEAEWMKFDVIILGDVGPKYLGEEPQRILRKFVTDRGGTLIVIAGQTYMPHVYAGTAFADLLPAILQRTEQPILAGPEKTFRIALTAEGRENVIMRQEVNPDENLEIWNAVPDIYWRHPILNTKEGATVLAYALPPSPPDFLPRKVSAEEAAANPLDEEAQRKRRNYERQNALLSYQSVAMGQVMLLSFDHTWRLRYRTGDTYHHRFWGQILRWATANKLPAGTETVKLGTDRTRYGPHAPVRVRAKLGQKDYTPIKSNDVAVNVFAGDQPVLRKQMQYLEDSPGMYVADLGEMPAGTYRVELEAPAARAVLAEQNVSKVVTEFSVEPSIPAEQTELVPDRGFLGRLASLTGGTLADPAHAETVLSSLGKPTEVQIEKHEYVIWDSWPLLVVMVLVATAEWLLRKKVGLA